MVKKAFGWFYIGLIIFLMYAPILVLFAFSFSSNITVGAFKEFTFDLYAKLFNGSHSAKIGDALINTLIIGFSASALSLVLGTLAAIGLSNMKKRPRAIFSTLAKLPMINAEIVTALCFMLLFALFAASGINLGSNNMLLVILAHTAFCTPYVMLNVLPKLQQMNRYTYEAAIDLGATPSQALFKVIFPEIAPGMISGFVMAFTISVDDFVITQFTKQGFDTLSTYIYTSGIRKPMPPEFRALSVIIFVVVLGILLLLNRKSAQNIAAL